jgi:hypothetical protein
MTGGMLTLCDGAFWNTGRASAAAQSWQQAG